MNVKAIQMFTGLICALVTITSGGAVVPKAYRPNRPSLRSPAGCCSFETDVCGFTSPSSNWFWSSSLLPATPVPAHDGNYIWSEIAGSSLLSGHIAKFEGSTPFTMDYYISAPGVHVDLYFHMDSPATTVYAGNLTYSPGVWNTNPRYCTDCCGSQSECAGYFEIRIAPTTPPFVMAVDNTQINGSCQDSFPCCYFRDSNMCDFTFEPAPITWSWFPNTKTKNQVQLSIADDKFIFFETVNYKGPAFSAAVRSPLVTVDSTQEFQIYLLAETPTASLETDTLDCYFIDMATGIRTKMDSVKSTSGQWVFMRLFCSSPNGDCCQGAPNCNGYVEFVANVDGLGGSMDYAIESFQIGYSCARFP